MVQVCRGVGQVLLLLCSETCGNGEDGCGVSLFISISISTIVSQ